ncbi:hypothetical protein BC827DRAFT_1214866 [Russula dissimulans]|nr:hypothetical protein BC827DRAFT_1214866 [Russula dissimulans]
MASYAFSIGSLVLVLSSSGGIAILVPDRVSWKASIHAVWSMPQRRPISRWAPMSTIVRFRGRSTTYSKITNSRHSLMVFLAFVSRSQYQMSKTVSSNRTRGSYTAH